MRSCVFCATPLHAMNVVFLKETILKNDNVDLYVVKNFRDSDTIIENFIKIKLFANIFILDIDNLKKSIFTCNGECKKIIQYYFPQYYLRILLGKNIDVPNDYDNIFLGSIKLYDLTMICHCKHAKVYLYDDGLNSYSGNEGLEEINRLLSPFRRCIYKILGENINRFFPVGMYVHRVDFCRTLWTENIMPLTGDIIHIEKLYSLFSNIFPYENDEIYDKYTDIYLSQPNDSEAYQKLNLKIENILKENNVIFRRHPREKLFNDENVIYETKHNMWEMVCKNQITDKHCLISNLSTGVFMPKLLFDKEPKVIFLFPMYAKFYQKQVIKQKMDIIERFRSIYSDSEKIVLVNSFEELMEKVSAGSESFK